MSSKVVLVTGGAIRIGREICNTFHDEGYKIICHYNGSSEQAKELAKKLNKNRKNSCKIIKFDLNQIEKYDDFIKKLSDLFGSIEILINNASSFYKTVLGESSFEDWEKIINSNLRGPYILSEKLSTQLNSQNGKVINVSDAIAIKGIKDYTIYSIAKSGLETLTKSLAKELAPQVRVNAIAPGAILLPSDGSSNEDKLLSQIPLGRLGSEKDIALAALAVSKFSYMTGQVLKIDGGRSLN